MRRLTADSKSHIQVLTKCNIAQLQLSDKRQQQSGQICSSCVFLRQPRSILSSSYNVCIRPEEGYCCIRYSACADTSSIFAPARRRRSLDFGDDDEVQGQQNVAPGFHRQARQPPLLNLGLTGTLCTTDYITIAGSLVYACKKPDRYFNLSRD